jgi:hypothetical protein
MSDRVLVSDDRFQQKKTKLENANRDMRIKFYKRIKIQPYRIRKAIRYGIGTFMFTELVNDIFLVERPVIYADVLHDVHVMLALSTGQTVFTTIGINGPATEKEARVTTIVRHLDQLVSGCLQLRTYWRMAQINADWKGSLLKLLVPYVIMIISLYLVDLRMLSPKIGYPIAIAALVFILVEVWTIRNFAHRKGVYLTSLAAFFFLWILYVIPRFCENFELRDSLFVLLDGLQRVGYTAVLAAVISHLTNNN